MQDHARSAASAAEAPDLVVADRCITWRLFWCGPWRTPPRPRSFGSTPLPRDGFDATDAGCGPRSRPQASGHQCSRASPRSVIGSSRCRIWSRRDRRPTQADRFFSGSDRRDRKIVNDQDADLGDGGEALAEAPVSMAEGELFEQPRRARTVRSSRYGRLDAQAHAKKLLPLPVAPWIKTF